MINWMATADPFAEDWYFKIRDLDNFSYARHLDFVHRNIHRASRFTLILIDDCARFVVGHGVDDAERAELVIPDFSDGFVGSAPDRDAHEDGTPDMDFGPGASGS
jgi:hypothetical protein